MRIVNGLISKIQETEDSEPLLQNVFRLQDQKLSRSSDNGTIKG